MLRKHYCERGNKVIENFNGRYEVYIRGIPSKHIIYLCAFGLEILIFEYSNSNILAVVVI